MPRALLFLAFCILTGLTILAAQYAIIAIYDWNCIERIVGAAGQDACFLALGALGAVLAARRAAKGEKGRVVVARVLGVELKRVRSRKIKLIGAGR